MDWNLGTCHWKTKTTICSNLSHFFNDTSIEHLKTGQLRGELRGDCEEFYLRISAELYVRSFCEAAEVLAGFWEAFWGLEGLWILKVTVYRKVSRRRFQRFQFKKLYWKAMYPTKSHIKFFPKLHIFCTKKCWKCIFLDLRKTSAFSRRPVFANPRLRRYLNLRKIDQSTFDSTFFMKYHNVNDILRPPQEKILINCVMKGQNQALRMILHITI